MCVTMTRVNMRINSWLDPPYLDAAQPQPSVLLAIDILLPWDSTTHSNIILLMVNTMRFKQQKNMDETR